jgi:hypothetical protein
MAAPTMAAPTMAAPTMAAPTMAAPTMAAPTMAAPTMAASTMAAAPAPTTAAAPAPAPMQPAVFSPTTFGQQQFVQEEYSTLDITRAYINNNILLTPNATIFNRLLDETAKVYGSISRIMDNNGKKFYLLNPWDVVYVLHTRRNQFTDILSQLKNQPTQAGDVNLLTAKIFVNVQIDTSTDVTKPNMVGGDVEMPYSYFRGMIFAIRHLIDSKYLNDFFKSKAIFKIGGINIFESQVDLTLDDLNARYKDAVNKLEIYGLFPKSGKEVYFKKSDASSFVLGMLNGLFILSSKEFASPDFNILKNGLVTYSDATVYFSNKGQYSQMTMQQFLATVFGQ